MQPRTRISSPHLSRYTAQHFFLLVKKRHVFLGFYHDETFSLFCPWQGKCIMFGVSPSLLRYYTVPNIEIWPFFSTKSSELFMFTQNSPVHIISIWAGCPDIGRHWMQWLVQSSSDIAVDRDSETMPACQASSALCRGTNYVSTLYFGSVSGPQTMPAHVTSLEIAA